MIKKLVTALITLNILLPVKAQVEPLLLYKVSHDEGCKQWVDSVFDQLSLKEKVGQLFIYTIAPLDTKPNQALLRDAVETHKVGGLLFSGGQMATQVMLTNHAQDMAEVPLMITFDGEWGLAMRLKEIPAFPRNMVLGCIQDDNLIREYGREVARQCREIGVHVNFAPVADININPKNPVINTRSFGEDPVNVANKVIAYSAGLEGGRVLPVAKHFPGHGDTDVDSHDALPVLRFTRARLDSVELYPFRELIRTGIGSVMVGHLQVPVLEPKAGIASSLSPNVIQKLLVDEMGYKGLIFTDALAMKGVSLSRNISLEALKAGNDMVLAPRNLREEINAVLAAIKKGEISEAEIERKCRKVLTYKYALEVNRQSKIQLSGLSNRVNTPEFRNLIDRLKLAAVTVVSNNNQILPFHPDLDEIALLTVGDQSANRTFGNTLEEYVALTRYQLRPDMSEQAQQKLRTSLANHKRVVVCVNTANIGAYRKFFSAFRPGVPVVYVFLTSEKPMLQVPKSLLNASAVVLGHSTDTVVQRRIANVLFGRDTANGRLSASVGDVFKPGDGVTIDPSTPYHFIPEEYGVNSRVLNRIDTIARSGITGGAFPGCQVVVMKNGRVMYNKAFGTFSGSKSQPVTPNSIYDIASLSKTSGTLLAVMKLYDRGLFNLTDKVSKHLTYLKGTDKEDITVRELLLHESGLTPTISFYIEAIDKESFPGRLFGAKKSASHNVQIDARTFAQSGFKFKKGFTSPVRTGECTVQVAENLWLNKSFKKEVILQEIINKPLGAKRYRYSCVGFILLQQMVEELSGMPMNDLLTQEFYDPMRLEHTTYLPLNSFSKEEIVPSTNDRFLRKGIVRGYVHDESAAFLGGVGGNAGLFSTAVDIAKIHQMILNGGEWEGRRYLSEKTCQVFTTQKSSTSRRGLGFDKPDVNNPDKSPCWGAAPAQIYGHNGFTGTCAWVDPKNELVFVFLSNRIYPDVWVNKLSKLQIREKMQEAMYESIKKNKK